MARTNRSAWRWAEIHEPLDRFAAEYGTARSGEVCELLARVAETPLDVDPGLSISGSPVRYTEIPGARVEFYRFGAQSANLGAVIGRAGAGDLRRGCGSAILRVRRPACRNRAGAVESVRPPVP